MKSLPPSVVPSHARRFFSCRLFALIVGLFLVASSIASAQTGRAGLITQAVNENSRVVLAGNTHPLATAAADRGAVEPSTPAERMLLLLRRSPERELALRGAIQSLHDKNSPNFHQWMTPEQFGAEWGAVDSDVAAVTAWLQSHGFQVKGLTAGRTAIEFSGTVGQVQEAFHTSIHSYMVDGFLHHANARDPEIPAALAPVVAGISTLNDFKPKSMAKKGPRGVFDADTHKVRPALTAVGSTSDFLYVVPSDAAIIYNSPIHALNPAYSGTKIDGTGAKIGILGDSNISTQQAKNYRALFGLNQFDTAANGLQVIIDGGTDPGFNGDEVEAYLDVELAGGLAPGAKVYFYTAADTTVNYGLDLATVRAVNDNFVDVLNMSFGACEGGLSTSSNEFYESIWEQAAAQGISVTVSTGDSGSAGCDDPNSQTTADYGLQINGLASTAFNIAVGGTDFAPLAGPDGFGADFTNYVSETNTPGTAASAKFYIPEVPWNDSSFTFPPTTTAKTDVAPDPYGNIVAGGGGRSNCAVGYFDNANKIHCQAGYSKPSWQIALTPNDQVRDVPDVSLFAAIGLDYAAWGICTDQDSLEDGTPIKDCTKGSDGLGPNEFYVYGVGGTSASSPAFAGVLALVHQSTGERQGQANYVLYNLAQTAPSVFHDVVTGNNSVPCDKGTLNCKLNAVGSYYLTGYDAVPGYDLASGLGSVDVAALIAGWSSSGLTSTTTQLSVTPSTLEHGQRVLLDAKVTTSGGSKATGSVAIHANASASLLGSTIGTYALGADGSTGEIPNRSLPGGSYSLIASYSGSGKNSFSASSPVAVTVSPESSTTVVSFTSYNPKTNDPSESPAVPYGFGVNFTAHPYGNRSLKVNGVIDPDGIATGAVAFSAGPTKFGTEPLSLDGYALSIGHLLGAGTYSVAAAYRGDNSLKPSTGVGKLVINKGETLLALTASATKYTGTPIVFKANLTTLSVGDAPTGVVVLKRGSTVLAQAPIKGTAATSTELAGGSVTIATSNLGTTAVPITAEYEGDANYAESTSNGVKVEGKPLFLIGNVNVTLPAEHSTGGAILTATSVNGYAGTINLTCLLISQTKANSLAPECAMYPTSIPLATGKTSQAEILIFGKGSKLPTSQTQSSNSTPSFGMKLGAGGAVLACCLLFGIPARRRGWRSILSVLLLLVAAAGFTACISTPKKISAGGYTFRVVGVDSADHTNSAVGIVKVNVL